ncbi:MAG TPA: hypothetical protein VMK12_18455 [Anaeromyxobacteraceae bacterium]|nr:hypothetical protein [Anaeromyxobacteraceae bacterium]
MAPSSQASEPPGIPGPFNRLQRERQTLEGLLARRDREAIVALHRNAQRLLRPLLVANPYARELTFQDDE